MIRVKLSRNVMVVEGHAGYDVEGKDVVCAAVSGMVQFAAYLVKRHGGSFIKEKGYLKIVSSGSEFEDSVIETLVHALKDLENRFPEHISVEVI